MTKKAKPQSEAERQMVRGYLAGLDDDLLPRKASVAYRHGWKNGQDDLIGKPREAADTLRRRAAMILGELETKPKGTR